MCGGSCGLTGQVHLDDDVDMELNGDVKVEENEHVEIV